VTIVEAGKSFVNSNGYSGRGQVVLLNN